LCRVELEGSREGGERGSIPIKTCAGRLPDRRRSPAPGLTPPKSDTDYHGMSKD